MLQGYSTTDSRGHTTVSYVCSNKRNNKSCDLKNVNANLANALVWDAMKNWLLSLNLDDISENIENSYKQEFKSVDKEEKEYIRFRHKSKI